MPSWWEAEDQAAIATVMEILDRQAAARREG